MAYFFIGLILVLLVIFGVKAFKKREVPHYPTILNEYTGAVDTNLKTPIEMVQQNNKSQKDDEDNT